MSDTASSAPNRAAPLALWRVAEGFMRILLNLFGEPRDIAFQRTHTARQRALMLPWLMAGEVLLRRLLLIEAAALPKTNGPPVRNTSAGKMPAVPVAPRKRRVLTFTHDKPEDWRVSFRCLARRAEPGCRGKRAKREALRFYNAWPLAERLEAMIRVFNEPLPYAKRLARRLHARPRRAGALLRLPPERERKAGDIAHLPDLIGREDFELVSAAARDARAAFNSS